ncbi:MAG: FtsX-like permease family protein [Peptostreptococcus sp.]|uniref:FtsX-like permease family protein n=1 Tax=Peptostreptococcus sp. TaxID=1262 RepID=UPI002FC6A649
MKKALWKDILKSFSKSKGRFFSIVCLIMLGSFALVGLRVTSPNMRITGEKYFKELNVADLTIMGDYGIDKSDREIINQASNIKDIEYAYLQDTTIKDTNKSIRVFSKPDNISKFHLENGRLPKSINEISLDRYMSNKYNIGDWITLTEKTNDKNKGILKNHKFKVVGFVSSGEIISSVNLGPTNVGTGQLDGYAVASKDLFDSEYYSLARLTFNDTQNLSPDSKEYSNKIQAHKNNLEVLLKNQGKKRFVSIKNEYQIEIDKNKDKLNEAKDKISDTKEQLKNANSEIKNAKNRIEKSKKELDDAIKTAQSQISDGEYKLNNAKNAISSSSSQFEGARIQLEYGKAALDRDYKKLENAKNELDSAKNKLDDSNAQLNQASTSILQGKQKIIDGYKEIANNKEKIKQGEKEIYYGEKELFRKEKELTMAENLYNHKLEKFNKLISNYEDEKNILDSKQADIDSANSKLESEKKTYEDNLSDKNKRLDEINNLLSNPDISDEDKTKLEQERDALSLDINNLQEEFNTFMNNIYSPKKEELLSEQEELDIEKSKLNLVYEEIQKMQSQLNLEKEKLDNGKKELQEARTIIAEKKKEIQNAKNQIKSATEELKLTEKLLKEKESEYKNGLLKYKEGLRAYNKNKNLYNNGLRKWQSGKRSYDQSYLEYEKNLANFSRAKKEITQKENELSNAKKTLQSEKASGENRIKNAESLIKENEKKYIDNKNKFENELPNAEKKIKKNEDKLNNAQDDLDSLKEPVYSVFSRRELPGSDGYKAYISSIDIIDTLANIFPAFLYFVAALVTFTTMSRFVDEERINMGILKALGYKDRDILKKFLVYGFASSTIGSILGIIGGHTILPLIAYNAYKTGFNVPKIELHFYPMIALLAIILGLISAVLPALLSAIKELREKPTNLMMAKAPSSGSKIFLERIPSIWNKMSFTEKVTSRNLFRYKKRMLMTIFGVCGSVALLFSGMSIQNSLNKISNKQFGEIIKYDLIVSEIDSIKPSQRRDLDILFSSDDIKSHTPIYYENMTKVAGENKDAQEITLLVPKNTKQFNNFIDLKNRKNQEKLNLDDNSVVISEHLAKLIGAKAGDTITLKDSNNKTQHFKLTAISEMYMGHFIFMSSQTYKESFAKEFKANSELVTLKNPSAKKTNEIAAKFMKEDTVQGVVQNTSLNKQIDEMVKSLDTMMIALIIVAAVLAVVILYNLTTINVSERIRELSTIKVLGFYDNEVMMYIYRETIILTILGILSGFILGRILHLYLINIIAPDDIMFDPSLSVYSFLLPIVIILGVTILLGYIVNNKLKNIDMLEALKSVE